MPTIAGLVAATACTSTDLLWINQGTGSDRDKSATLDKAVAGGLPAAVSGYSTATLAGTDMIPVVQTGPIGKRTTPVAVVSAGLASGISDLPAASTLDRTEIVPIVQSGTAKRLPISNLALLGDLPRAVDVAKNTTTPALWGTGSGGGWAVAWGTLVDYGTCVVTRAVQQDLSPGYTVDIHLVLSSYTTSDTGNVWLSIPEAALPSGWLTEIRDSTVLTSLANGIQVPMVYKPAGGSVTAGVGTVFLRTDIAGSEVKYFLTLVLPVSWSTWVPSSTAGASLWVSYRLPSSDNPAGDA